MKTEHKILLSLLLFSSLSLSACGPGKLFGPTLSPIPINTSTPTRTFTPTLTLVPTSTSTPRPTLTPVNTSTPTDTPTLIPTKPPAPVFIEPTTGKYRDWPRYLHTVYRFVFAVPPGWQVSELGTNFIQLSAPRTPEVKFTIGVRWVDEDVRIQRTGVPEGDVVKVGMVPFWGDEISKMLLVYQGKDKAILYNNATEFRVGDRYFKLGLDVFGGDYNAVDLPPGIEAAADGIVGSFDDPE